MEIIIKIAISVIVLALIYGQVIFLIGTWKSHIDPKATAHKIIQKLVPESEVLAKRDPKEIYQDGNPVGKVVGKITTTNEQVIFQYLCDTAKLNRNNPFEYGRDLFVIADISNESMQQLVRHQDGSSEMRNDTLVNVSCKRYK